MGSSLSSSPSDSIASEPQLAPSSNSQVKRPSEVTRWVRMAIFARLADTQPNSTLMGRILPGSIKNRVGFGFLKKKTPKRVRVRSGFLQNLARTRIRPNLVIYIYIYIITKISSHQPTLSNALSLSISLALPKKTKTKI